jgi:hypothetical protein
MPTVLWTARAAEAQTADQQGEAIWGTPPWIEFLGNLPSPNHLIADVAEGTCFEGNVGFGFPAGSDLLTADNLCILNVFGFPVPVGGWFRTDLGPDSTGSLPNVVPTFNPQGLYRLIRCGGFFQTTLNGNITNAVHCDLWEFQNAITLDAANQTASTSGTTPVTIDLTAGYIGVFPTSAALVGTVVGGTVSGFPGTTVTFTPDGSTGTAGFQFTLSNSGGTTSNTATVSNTVTGALALPRISRNGDAGE